MKWDNYPKNYRPVEVVEQFFYHTLEITQGQTIQNYTWFLPIPTDSAYLLERIVIAGLASDAIEGIVRISNGSNGRVMLESPLFLWAIRSKMKLTTPWMVYPGHMVMFNIAWKNPVNTGLDMFREPRQLRRLWFVLMGQSVISIKNRKE